MRCRVKSVPKGNNGLSLDNGNMEMLSSSMGVFQGPSHENGGIDINYKGNNAEVEGGESAFIDHKGDMQILGNMKFPGTNEKFKSIGKRIAKEEVLADKQLLRSTNLLDTKSPYNYYEALSFNSGKALQDASAQRKNLTSLQKEELANTQNMMLDLSDKLGVDPQELSKKFAKGGTIQARIIPQSGPHIYKDGGTLDSRYQGFLNVLNQEKIPYKLTSAVRDKGGDFSYHQEGKAVDLVPGNGVDYHSFYRGIMNNPKVMDYMANNDIGFLNEAPEAGGKKSKHWTGSHFHFGDDSKIKFSNNKVLQSAYKTATGKPYMTEMPEVTVSAKRKSPSDQFNFQPLPTGKIGSPDVGIYAHEFPKTPIPNDNALVSKGAMPYLPQNSLTPNTKPGEGYHPLDASTPYKPSLADSNKFNYSTILPELATLGERSDYVYNKHYQPNLYTPYQVSFQDKLNENNSTFRALTQQLPNNPEALSVLAGQKYNADSSVLGEQFRTNQGIQNDVTNKNVSLLNDASLKNLQLDLTQADTQSKNKSVTRSRKYAAANSIVSKIAQNKQENNTIRMQESMFDYRFNPQTGKMEYVGGPSYFPTGTTNTQNQVKYKRDAQGNLISSETTDYPQSVDEQQRLKTLAAKKKTFGKWGMSMKKC